MKVLVVGSSGQLGTEIRRLFELGESEAGVLPASYRETKPEVFYATRANVDISDPASVSSFFSDRSFDLVINCAAETNVEGCETDPVRAQKANTLGPMYLARECAKQKAKLVHISTDYVFSGAGERAYREDDPTGPLNAYGSSKLEGEREVLSACPESFIVRTAWLYAREGKNFVRAILSKARAEGKIGVVADQWGSPTNACDLALAILEMARSDKYGVYHVANVGVCSWYEFACAIVDEAGISCERIPLTTADYLTKAKRPRYSPLDVSKFEQTFNVEIRDWREALRSFIASVERTDG